MELKIRFRAGKAYFLIGNLFSCLPYFALPPKFWPTLIAVNAAEMYRIRKRGSVDVDYDEGHEALEKTLLFTYGLLVAVQMEVFMIITAGFYKLFDWTVKRTRGYSFNIIEADAKKIDEGANVVFKGLNYLVEVSRDRFDGVKKALSKYDRVIVIPR